MTNNVNKLLAVSFGIDYSREEIKKSAEKIDSRLNVMYDVRLAREGKNNWHGQNEAKGVIKNLDGAVNEIELLIEILKQAKIQAKRTRSEMKKIAR